MMATPLHQNGFTLLELLLVIALFSVTAALVAPDLFNTIAGVEQRLERNRLIDDRNTIQSTVFARDEPVRVTLEGRGITLTTLDGETIKEYQYDQVTFEHHTRTIMRSGMMEPKDVTVTIQGQQETLRW